MTAVFVHGNPETTAVWSSLVAALAIRGRSDVVCVSPPGFGSAVPDGFAATQVAYRDWLIAELGAFDGPIDLVGHDWGAAHVLGVVDARPDLVRTWATDCVGLMHPEYQWHDAAQAWQTPDVGEAVIEMMVDLPNADLAAEYESMGMPHIVAADLAVACNAAMGRCVLSLYRSAVQPAMRELGERLRSAVPLPPGLAFIATEDLYPGTPAMAAEVATSFGATTLRLEGEGHWWMFGAADPAADALVAHWS